MVVSIRTLLDTELCMLGKGVSLAILGAFREMKGGIEEERGKERYI